MKLNLYEIYYVNGHLAIKLSDLSKIIKYADTFLLPLIKRYLKKGLTIAYKWRRNWYILLPKTPIIYNPHATQVEENKIDENPEYPNGTSPNINWQEVLDSVIPEIREFYLGNSFNRITHANRLFLASSSSQSTLISSSLTSKNSINFIPLSLGQFRATTEYKYGYFIVYDPNKMSIFDPGAAGTLKSTQLPSALFEVARALDAAENARNGANPGLTPRRNISTTVSFDTGTIALAATIPITTSIGAGGRIDIVATDYLGSPYSTFLPSDGDLTSDTLVEALLETSSLLAAAEKAVTPADNQPNNVQITIDMEAGSATISANLPFTSAAAANGDVTIHAIDYL